MSLHGPVSRQQHAPKKRKEKKRTHKNLKSVEQRGGVCQAAKLKLGRVVLWNVSIAACAEEHLLYAAEKRVSQVLNGIHHHTAVDCVAWMEEKARNEADLIGRTAQLRWEKGSNPQKKLRRSLGRTPSSRQRATGFSWTTGTSECSD